jgi:AcrR family transcriptional regulator
MKDIPSRGALTRQAILDAAADLFGEQGYNGTSMRQIASRAGIALGGIYNHFESKEAIFQALIRERFPSQTIIEALAAISDGDGPAMLGEAFVAIQALGRRNMDILALVLTDLREFNGETVRERVGEVISGALPFALRLQRAGGLRPDIHPLVLLRLFVSVMVGYFVTDLVAYTDDLPLIPGLPPVADVRRGIVDIILHGAAAKDG